jgi:hypothetical protein
MRKTKTSSSQLSRFAARNPHKRCPSCVSELSNHCLDANAQGDLERLSDMRQADRPSCNSCLDASAQCVLERLSDMKQPDHPSNDISSIKATLMLQRGGPALQERSNTDTMIAFRRSHTQKLTLPTASILANTMLRACEACRQQEFRAPSFPIDCEETPQAVSSI